MMRCTWSPNRGRTSVFQPIIASRLRANICGGTCRHGSTNSFHRCGVGCHSVGDRMLLEEGMRPRTAGRQGSLLRADRRCVFLWLPRQLGSGRGVAKRGTNPRAAENAHLECEPNAHADQPSDRRHQVAFCSSRCGAFGVERVTHALRSEGSASRQAFFFSSAELPRR